MPGRKRADCILIAAMLLTLGAMLAWLYWPVSPGRSDTEIDARQPQVRPLVSPERPFNFSAKDYTVLNAASAPQDLRARVWLTLYAYTAPEEGVQEISARLSDQELRATLTYTGCNGVWQCTLAAAELPVDTIIPVQLELSTGATPGQIYDYEFRLPAPPVYPLKFWREPSGPVKPGERLTFNLLLNQSAILKNYNPTPTEPGAIDIPITESEFHEYAHGRASKDHYEYVWNWQKQALPVPGVEHPVTVTESYGVERKYQFELTGEPLRVDYQPVAILGVQFDPPPPLIRDSEVKAYVTLSRPVTTGEILVQLDKSKKWVPQGNGGTWQDQQWALQGPGCTWHGTVRCGWVPDDWDDPEPKLTCLVTHQVNGFALTTYTETVPLAPLPDVKLASYKQIQLPSALDAQLYELQVMLDPPVRYGVMTVRIGSPATAGGAHQAPPSCILYSDAAGVWTGRITTRGKPGNWGPVCITYRVWKELSKRGVAYETEFHPGDFIVEPLKS